MTTPDVSTLSMPIAALIASLIGASATITAALIQLRIAWRKEMKARENRAPITQKNRRGPVVAVIVLAVASAVGGFAMSQYFATRGTAAAQAMEAQVRTRLEQLSDVARRLERASLAREAGAVPVKGAGAVAVAVMLSPCALPTGQGERACTRQEAVRVQLCAELPAGTVATQVERYLRDQQAAPTWDESLIAPGQHPVDGEFLGDAAPGAAPQTLCQEYLHWSGEARIARLRVNYAPPVVALDRSQP